MSKLKNNNQELWDNYYENPNIENRNKILICYLPYMRSVVGKLASTMPAKIDMRDMMNEGFLGLSAAFQNYNPSRAVKFETYAHRRIRGSILDWLRNQDYLSRAERKRQRELGASHKKENFFLHLDAIDYDTGGRKHLFHDTVGFWEKTNPLENIQRKETEKCMKEKIKLLTPQEQDVIYYYFYRDFNHHEIGRVLNISESRSCQINKKAIGKLRKKLISNGMGNFNA
jgi:RNA polymerase sigma factor for flagellar operon FliA